MKGEKPLFEGALTSAGRTGFLAPGDEQPMSYHNCLLPALANITIFVLQKACLGHKSLWKSSKQ